MLLKEGHCFRENILSACGRAHLQPNVVFESGQFSTILAMVASGSGISVVPHMAVQAREGCRFIPLSDENAYRRLGIVQLKRRFCSRSLQAFLEHLQDGAKPLSYQAVGRKPPGLGFRSRPTPSQRSA